jgi:dTDP-4-amino-4,6-dideoxygalactose transaminase
MKIRFSQPVMVGRELDYVRQALEQRHLSSNGPFAHRCQAWLASRLNASRVHLTHSATAALELSALLAGLGPGDEVVMPAFTFVSCANAVALRGATPVFVDIRPDTLNLDPDEVAKAITARTRAIVAVHYAGIPCDIAAIAALADHNGLLVIEDAAQALMSTHGGRPAGTFGHFGVLSFHDTKNVISGEGGAIIVNDARFADRAEIVHMKGTDRGAFDRGLKAHYSWVDLGSSFAPNEVTAAVLLAQPSAPTRSRAAGACCGHVIIPPSPRWNRPVLRADRSFRTTSSTTGISTICCWRTRRRGTVSSRRCMPAASPRRSTMCRSTTRPAAAATPAPAATCR